MRRANRLALHRLELLDGAPIARARSRFLAFALMATLVPLAPALNVAFWIGTLLAERLLYIPSIGICLGAGYLLAQPFRAFLLYDCGSSYSIFTTKILIDVIKCFASIIYIIYTQISPMWNIMNHCRFIHMVT